ncbi:MAG: hypothetical protein Q9159_003585 [Coniocarpon cinnabarinum]
MATMQRRVLGERDVNAALGHSLQTAKANDVKSVSQVADEHPTAAILTSVESIAHTHDARPSEESDLAIEGRASSVLLGDPTTRKRVRADDGDEVASCEPSQSRRRRLASPFLESSFTSAPSNPLAQDQDLQQINQPTSQGSAMRTALPTTTEGTSQSSVAELLKTRLRLAAFKVKTDQTNTPLSRLETNQSEATMRPRIQIQDPPECIRQAFQRKQARRRSHPVPSLSWPAERAQPDQVPGPNGHPGSYHYIKAPLPQPPPGTDWTGEDGRVPATTEPVPTTPSSAGECSDCSDDEDIRDVDALATKAGTAPLRYAPISVQDRDLTSSAVKGQAADSLLQLGMGNQHAR